ncbi:MAG: GNAT family N-acetyltransferase [Flavobacteriaceae bacterium]|nr:GNAT family N-acetyltransferase [Flavobacteriaceae bacterium]
MNTTITSQTNEKELNAFRELNLAWLEKFFEVEAYDNEVLNNPNKYILEKKGQIFSILYKDEIIGTVALMYNELEELEFTKMAVSEEFQGKGLGKKLMLYVIEKAKEMKVKELILYSNTSLEPAINLYKKVGFIEIDKGETSYQRCNIKMSLDLFLTLN